MSDLDKDLFNLAMSDEALPLMDAVKKHIAENVEPNSRLSCQITVSEALEGLKVTMPESQH